MDLSIILCTWNNADRLRITLNAIAQCGVPEGLRWELVLVNNNSTDKTDAVAAEFAGRIPLRYVHQPTPGLSHARNAGLAAATGELVVFTDDDVRPYPEWITAYWDAYQRHPEGYYFGGPIESEFEDQDVDMDLVAYGPPSVKGLDRGAEEVAGPGLKFVSANWGCPRSVLNRVGGFDTGMGLVGGSAQVSVGEETDLMRRLQGVGMTPRYLPQTKLRHFVPESKTDLRHIAARQAADGYYKATVLRSTETARSPRVFGVPAGTLALGAKFWLMWLRLRLRGQRAELLYIRWRHTCGEIRGAFSVWRGRIKPGGTS